MRLLVLLQELSREDLPFSLIVVNQKSKCREHVRSPRVDTCNCFINIETGLYAYFAFQVHSFDTKPRPIDQDDVMVFKKNHHT